MDSELQPQLTIFACFNAVNHNYGENRLTTCRMDQNPPITAHEHDLLTPLSQTLLFAKRSGAVLDADSEKRNGWLNFELN